MQFKPMLAETADLDKLVFPLIAQPKFDGIRCTVLPDLGPVTRTLKPIPNRFVRNCLNNAGYHYYDGEIVTYTNGIPDELNTVQSKVMSAEGEFPFVFHTFDHVQFPSDPFEERRARLSPRTGNSIRCEGVLIESLEELSRYEDMLVSDGWEGVILRKPGSPYKFGRSTQREGYLLKMKRFHDAEAKVVAFVEKMHNTNEQTRDERGYAKRSSAKAGLVPAGTLGALRVVWGNGIEFEIGTGFDDEMRDFIWRNRARLKSRKVTFKYQRIGPNGAPLLPVFKAFRSDEDIV